MELFVKEALFGFDVIRNNKPIKWFKNYKDAVEYASYYNGKKKHKWDVPSGDYFKKTYVCKDCGIIKHSLKQGSNYLIHYTLDGITYDRAPGCKFNKQ